MKKLFFCILALFFVETLQDDRKYLKPGWIDPNDPQAVRKATAWTPDGVIHCPDAGRIEELEKKIKSQQETIQLLSTSGKSERIAKVLVSQLFSSLAVDVTTQKDGAQRTAVVQFTPTFVEVAQRFLENNDDDNLSRTLVAELEAEFSTIFIHIPDEVPNADSKSFSLSTKAVVFVGVVAVSVLLIWSWPSISRSAGQFAAPKSLFSLFVILLIALILWDANNRIHIQKAEAEARRRQHLHLDPDVVCAEKTLLQGIYHTFAGYFSNSVEDKCYTYHRSHLVDSDIEGSAYLQAVSEVLGDSIGVFIKSLAKHAGSALDAFFSTGTVFTLPVKLAVLVVVLIVIAAVFVLRNANFAIRGVGFGIQFGGVGQGNGQNALPPQGPQQHRLVIAHEQPSAQVTVAAPQPNAAVLPAPGPVDAPQLPTIVVSDAFFDVEPPAQNLLYPTHTRRIPSPSASRRRSRRSFSQPIRRRSYSSFGSCNDSGNSELDD